MDMPRIDKQGCEYCHEELSLPRVILTTVLGSIGMNGLDFVKNKFCKAGLFV